VPAVRYWTTAEERKLRELYPMLGTKGMLEHLPGRTRGQIGQKASELRVRFTGSRQGGKPAKYHPTHEMDAAIRRVYQGTPVRGAVKRLAAELELPDWWVKRRAAQLGVSRPQRKPSPWSEAEIAIVREHHHRDLEVIRRRLAEAGFRRSRTAIHIIRKRRLRLSPRPDDRYTATELAKLLGVDSKTVGAWCDREWLEAERRGTDRTEVQGGDMWWIEHAAVRRFVIENTHLVNLRKVTDAEWFIHLAAGKAADGRQHRRKRPGRNGDARAAA